MLFVRLLLVDIARRSTEAEVPGACAIFRTCVREVIFLDESAGATSPDVDSLLLRDGEAYARLLEVVCGLWSPMPGETQVQGQFKAFLDSLDASTHGWLKRIGQQVLSDARAIREAHLRGLGSRTYGSTVRRHARDCSRVAVIGAGSLASEIATYVADTHVIDEWTRASLACVDDTPDVSGRTVLVVAAPVDSSLIDRVARVYPDLQRILDLRADVERAPISTATTVVTLHDVFAGHRPDAASAAQICAAKATAARCGRRFDGREELHPYGWEDLCA